MNKTQWKPVENYEGIYEVSDTGNVRSVTRTLVDYRGFSRSKKGKIIAQSTTNKGYRAVCLCNGKFEKEKQVLIHRLVAKAFIPNPENKKEVNHKDGNKQNNTVENLEWVTPSENIQHAHKNNLIKNIRSGEDQARAVLSNNDVVYIRKSLRNESKTVNELADELRVNSTTIRRAANGSRYKSCEEPPIQFSMERISESVITAIQYDYHYNNTSVSEISKKFNIPISTIYHFL